MTLFEITTVTVKRRAEGDRQPGGEVIESWAATTAGTSVSAHIQPMSVTLQAALRQATTGQSFPSSHLIVFKPGVDVKTDDRVFEDVGDNQYVVRSVNSWPTHIEVTAGITDID